MPVLACGTKTVHQPPAPMTPVRLPRYFVHITASGGPDAILLSNPKQQREVDASVDVPYGSSDIIEVGNHRYGPNLEPLKPWLSQLTFVNNVDCSTVQHPTELTQAPRLRRHTQFAAPLLAEIVGQHVEGVGTPSVNMGAGGLPLKVALDCSRPFLDRKSEGDLCRDLLAQSPEDLLAAASDLEILAARPSATDEVRATATRSAQLMRAFASAQAQPFVAESWGEFPAQKESWRGERGEFVARDLQLLLWMIEHDIASAYHMVPATFAWDSHADNTKWQTHTNTMMNRLLARFFDELHRRRNRHGTLAENTVVVYGTSIGRFPAINTTRGKDHFPEASFLVFGPNVPHGEVFGASGRRMEGLPVNLATGRVDAKQGRKIELDDLGATILERFGIDPRPYGYSGTVLEFLKGRA